MKKPRNRQLSDAFAIENEGDPLRERLVLCGGTDMEPRAEQVEKVRLVLQNSLRYAALPRKPETLADKAMLWSMLAFYGAIIMSALVMPSLRALHAANAVNAFVGMYLLGSVAVTFLAFIASVFMQSVQMVRQLVSRISNPTLFEQNAVRGEFCCIEALKAFPTDVLSYVCKRIKWERGFQAGFYAFLGVVAFYFLSPPLSEQLKHIAVFQQYWMLAPSAVAVPLVFFFLTSSPILTLDRALYLVELSIEGKTTAHGGRHKSAEQSNDTTRAASSES